MQQRAFDVVFHSAHRDIELLGNLPLFQAFEAVEVENALAQRRQLGQSADQAVQSLFAQDHGFGATQIGCIGQGRFRPVGNRGVTHALTAVMVEQQILRGTKQVSPQVADLAQVFAAAVEIELLQGLAGWKWHGLLAGRLRLLNGVRHIGQQN